MDEIRTDGTETQRQPVPRVDDGELATGLAFLQFARGCVLKKLEGVTDDDLRRALVPSGTNLLGLVQHLAASEWYWFGYTFAGEDLGAPHDDAYFSMTVAPERTTAEVVSTYREICARVDAIVVAAGDPAALTVEPVDDRRLALRWVLAHMTTETTRHAGHADILREQLDGVTGR